MSKSTKTFKQYYHEDPEFRKRHLKKMLEKVPCECGFVTARNNLSKHRKSRNHQRRMEQKEVEKAIDHEELEALKIKISRLERKIKKIGK